MEKRKGEASPSPQRKPKILSLENYENVSIPERNGDYTAS